MKVPRIIDFRCRPPITAQKLLFEMKLARLEWENKFVCPPGNVISPSMNKVGEKEGIDLLRREMDEAGVDLIVVPGRNVSDTIKAAAHLSATDSINITDQMLLELGQTLDHRAIGLHGIDLAKPVEKVVTAIETAHQDHGLPGAVLEPAYVKTSDGRPLAVDNRTLYPIYETMVKLDAFLMVQSGIYAGHDIGANDWPPLDRVMQDFPGLKLVLAHGGYPRVLDAIALAVKHQHFYLSPDIYCFFPGGKLYVDAISQLPDQFIFGTAYPFGALKESVDLSLEFPLSDAVMQKYMSANAARLLKL